MKVPEGIVVPSENVKSFIVLRAIMTALFTVGKRQWYDIEYVHAPTGANRIVSLTKLSNLVIFAMEALPQPSSRIIASISSRKGRTYSGWAAKSYSECVTVCERNK